MFTINEFQVESNLSEEFEYDECENDNFELFFIDSEDMFLTWNLELIPEDVSYISNPKFSPILKDKYPTINLYDEKSLNNMIFTINSITTINKFKNMNYFMNRYFLFQLSMSGFVQSLDKELLIKLREKMFKYFMYTHPMNETDRFSFDLIDDKIFFNENIELKEYVGSYYDFYINNKNQFKDKIKISEIQLKNAKNLSLLILGCFESRIKLKLNVINNVILNKYVNDVDLFVQDYRNSREVFFDFILSLHNKNLSEIEKLGLDYLMQNYVCYILYFDPCEIDFLFNYFEGETSVLDTILNSINSNSIFFEELILKKVNKETREKIIDILM